MNNKLTVIPTPCGTCDHRHSLRGCPDCGETGRQCPGWTEHPVEAARAADQELRELSELGGLPLVDVHLSDGVMEILAEVEAKRHAGAVVGDTPMIVAMQLYETRRVFNAEEHIIRACQLRTPDALFARDAELGAAGDPRSAQGMLACDEMLARLATAWFYESAPKSTIAWGIVCAGICETEADGRRPAHIAAAVDLDGRAYSIARDTATGEIESDITSMPNYARLLRKDVTLFADDPVGQLKADGLSPPHMVVMHLTVTTRMCMDLAADAEELWPC